jgi:hypothetical protein
VATTSEVVLDDTNPAAALCVEPEQHRG